jgi:hypothetical protein
MMKLGDIAVVTLSSVKCSESKQQEQDSTWIEMKKLFWFRTIIRGTGQSIELTRWRKNSGCNKKGDCPEGNLTGFETSAPFQ